MTAAKRRSSLIRYVKKQKKMPKSPANLPPLNEDISLGLFQIDGGRVRPDNSCFSVEEMWFLFRAAKKLGFKPRWDK